MLEAMPSAVDLGKPSSEFERVADISEEGITVLSERAEIIGSNSSNKQILEEKINDLNLKLKKPEIAEDKTLKDELEFLNFVLEKSN